MATVGSFDLISQPLRADSFPWRRSLSSEHPTPTSHASTLPQSVHSADSPLSEGARRRCVTANPYRPSSVCPDGQPPSPGEGYSQKFRGGSSESMAPPTRREAAPRKFLRIKFVGVPPPLQAPSLASLKSHFHPQIVSLTFKVPSLFGGADVLIYRHKVRRGRGADAGERSPDEPTAHPRDRPLSGVFIDVFSFLFLFSGGRVSPAAHFFT